MNIARSTIQKITIHVSRKEMWENYVTGIAEMGRDLTSNQIADSIKDVHEALFGDSPSNAVKIRNLFKQGDTFMLIPAAMEEFDKPNVHREIVVINDAGMAICIIDHDYINF